MTSLFEISQLTLPVATILGTAWVIVSGQGGYAFPLFIGGLIFTVLLRLIEQEIFANNVYCGRYFKSNY